MAFWQFYKASVVAGTLLIANFPVAATYTILAMDIESRYYVAVENRREQPIESFLVTGGGVQVDFGLIPPNARVCRSFHIVHDGQLSFQTYIDGVETTGIVDGYVTGSLGGNKQIRIDSDNTIGVSDNDDT